MSDSRQYNYVFWSKKYFLFFATFTLATLLSSCEDVNEIVIYDPNSATLPAPSISSITPENSYFAGYKTITIHASNLPSDKDEIYVYFNNIQADVLNVQGDQLTVYTPNLPGDVEIKIATKHALDFSNIIQYELKPLIEEVDVFLNFETPWAITTDENGDLYVNYTGNNNAPNGVTRIDNDGNRSQYVPIQNWRYSAIKFDKKGNLFGVRGNAPIIYRATPGGSTFAVWKTGGGLGRNLAAIDFDDENIMWASGSNNAIYRLEEDASMQTFSTPLDIRHIKYQNNSLYVIAIDTDGGNSLYRIPIENSQPAEPVLILNTSQLSGASNIYGVEFDINSNMYIGTDGDYSMYIIRNTTNSAEPFLPGIIGSPGLYMSWKDSNYMYVTKGSSATDNTQRIFLVNMLVNE